MWSDNTATAYIVLGLGNWLGGATKGVTGFGSAILNLCCWIAFSVAGIDSGSLQQAVVSEALASTLIAPGLLYITKAHTTADFKMVAAIALFVTLSSPVGAAVLAHLDAKNIELVMATTLLVIIVAEQLPRALYCVKQRSTCSSSGQVVQPQLSLQEEQQPAERANLAPADASCQPGVWPACPEPDIEQGLQAAAPDGAAALCSSHTFSGHNTSNALHCYSCSSSSSSLTSSNSTQNDAQQHRATDDGQLVTALAPDAHSGDCTVCVCDTSIVLELPDNSKGVVDGRAQHPSQQTYHSPDRGGQRGQLGHRSHRAAWFARAWGGGNHWSPAFGDIKAEHSSDTLQLLLSDSSVCATDGESQSACCSQSSSLLSSSSSSTHGGGGDGSLQPESSMQEHNSGSSSILSGRGAQAWLQVLAVGSIAGTLSGIMEGLTGMNGPPIMFMYRRLNTPKATVRGNNAFLNLLQMRLIPYWYMGLMTAWDLQLYAVTGSVAVVGVVMGDALSHRMDQKVFQQVLGVLMVLCCGLMFASGLGLVV